MRRFALAFVTLALTSSAATAQWITVPDPDNYACSATGAQLTPVAVTDGAGGVVTVWRDQRTSGHTDLYAQHTNAAGYNVWASNGVVVDSMVGTIAVAVACSDDSGGVIVAWLRSGGVGANRVFAQRVDANGQVRWAPGGVRVSSAELTQSLPRIVEDGAGGAMVLWAHWKGGPIANVYGQRLNRDGAKLWSATGDSVVARGEVRSFQVLRRPGGGAYIGWWQTYGVPSVIAIDVNGHWAWGAPDTITTAAMSTAPPRLNLARTGTGFVALCSGGYQMYARRFDDGGAAWPTSVRVVSGAWTQAAPRVTTDDAGGFYVSWIDGRPAGGGVFLQRMRSDGTSAWIADGIRVTTTRFTSSGVDVAPDGSGGAWITWCAYPGTLAQRYSAAGTPWIAGTGTVVSGVNVFGFDIATLLPIANNGLIIVASDDFGGTRGYDVWMKCVYGNGSLGTTGVEDSPRAARAGLSLAVGPNPVRDRAALRFTLPHEGRVTLELFGLAGERVATIADETLPAGEHVRTLDAGALPPGVYHARLATSRGVTTTRLVRVR